MGDTIKRSVEWVGIASPCCIGNCVVCKSRCIGEKLEAANTEGT